MNVICCSVNVDGIHPAFVLCLCYDLPSLHVPVYRPFMSGVVETHQPPRCKSTKAGHKGRVQRMLDGKVGHKSGVQTLATKTECKGRVKKKVRQKMCKYWVQRLDFKVYIYMLGSQTVLPFIPCYHRLVTKVSSCHQGAKTFSENFHLNFLCLSPRSHRIYEAKCISFKIHDGIRRYDKFLTFHISLQSLFLGYEHALLS